MTNIGLLCSSDTDRAVGLLTQYQASLTRPEEQVLKNNVGKVSAIFGSQLFQALLGKSEMHVRWSLKSVSCCPHPHPIISKRMSCFVVATAFPACPRSSVQNIVCGHSVMRCSACLFFLMSRGCSGVRHQCQIAVG